MTRPKSKPSVPSAEIATPEPLPRRGDREWSPFRRARGNLAPLIATIVSEALARETTAGTRKRARKARDAEQFALSLEALVADAVHLYLAPGDAHRLRLSLGNDSLRAAPRYRPEAKGEAVKQVLTLLPRPEEPQESWLDFWTPTTAREQSSYAAGPKLREAIRRCGSTLADTYSHFGETECIEMRAPKEPKAYLKPRPGEAPPTERSFWNGTPPVKRTDYPETPETERLRRQVRQINSQLQALSVDRIGADGERRPLDMRAVFLRRIFTNSSFESGGRFFPLTAAAEWYNMGSRERRDRLLIGGEEVACVDIKACSITVLYADAGIPLPEGDLYEPPGYDKEHRADFKLAAQCLAFRQTPRRTWPKLAKNEEPPKLSAKEAFTALEEYHAPISHLFWKGRGHHTQRVESDVIAKVLEERPELSALPLHDELIVPIGKAEDAKRAMDSAFRRITGGSCRITISAGQSHVLEGVRRCAR